MSLFNNKCENQATGFRLLFTQHKEGGRSKSCRFLAPRQFIYITPRHCLDSNRGLHPATVRQSQQDHRRQPEPDAFQRKSL